MQCAYLRALLTSQPVVSSLLCCPHPWSQHGKGNLGNSLGPHLLLGAPCAFFVTDLVIFPRLHLWQLLQFPFQCLTLSKLHMLTEK